MKRHHHHNALLACALCVTAFVGSVFFYMRHMVAVSSEHAVAANSAILSGHLRAGEQKGRAKLYADTAGSRARERSFFVSSDGIVSFIEAIEALGAQAGSKVVISAVDADKAEQADANGVGSFRAHIDADGSWPAVMRTLVLAEAFPYGVSIRNVRLDGSAPVELTAGAKASRSDWHLAFDLSALMIFPNK